MKRRILHELRLDKIAAVDAPCQEGALAVIMKRKDGEQIGKLDRMDDQGFRHDTFRTGGPEYSPASARRLLGTDDDEENKVLKNFDDAVNWIAKRDGVLKTVAMERARKEFPKEFAAYQNEGAVSSRPIFKSAEQPDAILKFEKLIDHVQVRDKCRRLEALQKAAREYPAEVEAYRTAQA